MSWWEWTSRKRVIEHRVTSHIFGLTIRWWIESDPAYGGLHLSQIPAAIAAAEDYLKPSEQNLEIVALNLLNACSAANSIEVCNPSGNGVAVHRDWP